MPREGSPEKGYRVWYTQTFNEVDKQVFLILNAIMWPIWIIVTVVRGFTEGFLTLTGNIMMLCVLIMVAIGIPLFTKAQEWYTDRKTIKYNIPQPDYHTSRWSLLPLMLTYLKKQGYSVDDSKYREKLIILKEQKVRLDIVDRESGANAYLTIVLCQRKASDEFFTQIQKFIEQKIEVIYTEKRLSDSISDYRGTEDGEPEPAEEGTTYLPIPGWLHGAWKLEYGDRSKLDGETTESKTVIHRSGDTSPEKIVWEEISEDLSREIRHVSITSGFTVESYPNVYVLAKDQSTGDFIIPKDFIDTGVEKVKTQFSEFDAIHISYEGFRRCEFCHGKKRTFKCPFCKGIGGSNISEHMWYDVRTGILLKSQSKDLDDGSETVTSLLTASGVLGQGAP